jgi:hypothetical protein
MKKTKRFFATTLLSVSLLAGALLAPVKKADAGVIVMTATSTVAMPVGLALAGLFGGLGTVVFSIYWAIDHRDKSWYALGLFMLDAHISNNEVSKVVAAKYPELDSFVVDELSRLIILHESDVLMGADGYKEVLIPESDLRPILDIVAETHPELADKLFKDMTLTIN